MQSVQKVAESTDHIVSSCSKLAQKEYYAVPGDISCYRF